MNSRKAHAVSACLIFFCAAKTYEIVGGQPLDAWRVLFWSIAGIAVYIGLSGVFGFDPHRTKLPEFEPPLVHYIDRWELKLGQATLTMLGSVVLAAGLIDPENFVTAVVCGTLSAWTYFAFRLYQGGYKPAAARAGRQ
jgi:hypothetical protein